MRVTHLLVVLGVGTLIFPSCKKREVRETRYPNGAMRARGNVQQDADGNYVLVGTWTFWQPNGQKEAEGEYLAARESGKRGTTGILVDGRQGAWTFWRSNGQKETEASYSNGAQEGVATTWYANGQKESEANWKGGKKQGREISWSDAGQKTSESEWDGGERTGLLVQWYENGSKELEGRWRGGKEIGIFTIWYKSGSKKMENSYKDGVLDGPGTQWHENGQKKFAGTWTNGIGEGAVTTWYDNGQMESNGAWKNDKKDGRWTFWRKNGKLVAEATFKNGTPLGQVIGWDENGKKAQVSFSDAPEDGAAPAEQPGGQVTDSRPPLSPTSPVVFRGAQEALEFGKPTVKVERGLGMLMNRVMVQARNVSDQRMNCLVTATFLRGDTILGTASGAVNGIPPAGTKTAQLMGTDDIKGYDSLRLETGACF